MSAADLVYIRTENGYWREDARGYTNRPARAATWPRREAERMTRHLGPEKCLRLIPAPSPHKEPELQPEPLRAAAPRLYAALKAVVDEARAFQSPEIDDDDSPFAALFKEADEALMQARGEIE